MEIVSGLLRSALGLDSDNSSDALPDMEADVSEGGARLPLAGWILSLSSPTGAEGGRGEAVAPPPSTSAHAGLSSSPASPAAARAAPLSTPAVVAALLQLASSMAEFNSGNQQYLRCVGGEGGLQVLWCAGGGEGL